MHGPNRALDVTTVGKNIISEGPEFLDADILIHRESTKNKNFKLQNHLAVIKRGKIWRSMV